jgi:hypothetical protein
VDQFSAFIKDCLDYSTVGLIPRFQVDMRTYVMSTVSVRKAVLEDAEVMCAVHKAAVHAFCVEHYTPEQIEAWVGDR